MTHKKRCGSIINVIERRKRIAMLTLAIEPHKKHIKINSKCIKIEFEVYHFVYTDIFQPNLVAMRAAVPSENNAHTHKHTTVVNIQDYYWIS